MERGQVFLLKPEADGKQRPMVVVSRDDLNRGHSVVVMPCYSQQVEKRTKLPYCVLLNAGEGGLDKDRQTIAITNNIRRSENCGRDDMPPL